MFSLVALSSKLLILWLLFGFQTLSVDIFLFKNKELEYLWDKLPDVED